jgi:hypothetical protein
MANEEQFPDIPARTLELAHAPMAPALKNPRLFISLLCFGPGISSSQQCNIVFPLRQLRRYLSVVIGVGDFVYRDELCMLGFLSQGGATFTVAMPADSADVIPMSVSSKTKQASGLTPSCAAASRKGSGSGLPLW